MKKTVFVLFAAAFVAGSVMATQAASAVDLIEAHYKAIGGVEAHKKINSRVIKAVLDIPAQGFSAEILIQNKAPDKMRSELEIPNAGKFVEGFDGKVAWADTPFTGVIEKPADQQEMARRQADFYQAVELLSRFESWTIKGKETIKGKPAHVLEGKSEDGATGTIYLDESTLLIARVKGDVGGQEIVTDFADYQEVDGIKIPFLIQMDAGPSGVLGLKIKEVKHSVELDDQLFIKPAK